MGIPEVSSQTWLVSTFFFFTWFHLQFKSNHFHVQVLNWESDALGVLLKQKPWESNVLKRQLKLLPSKWSNRRPISLHWKILLVNWKSWSIWALILTWLICWGPVPNAYAKVREVTKHFHIKSGHHLLSALKGELLVIVEYCRYGNLQVYLVNHRHKFINLVDEFGNMKSENETDDVDHVGRYTIEKSFCFDMFSMFHGDSLIFEDA